MDFPIVYVLAIGALIGALLVAATRQMEIFRIVVENGRPRVVRGAPPPGFLGDVRTIARGVRSATIRAVKEGGQPRIVASREIDEPTLQRLRNAFATYPAARGS